MDAGEIRGAVLREIESFDKDNHAAISAVNRIMKFVDDYIRQEVREGVRAHRSKDKKKT